MKTAGTSVSCALGKTLKLNDLILGGTTLGERIQAAYKDQYKIDKHSRAKEIKNAIGEELWNTYFSFTFVRNPYTRAVSLYTYIEKMVATRKSDDVIYEWPITQAFVQTVSFSEFIRNKNFIQSMGGQPQVHWVLDDNGECIIDFIGKVENINDDFFSVTSRIGIKNEGLDLMNASHRAKLQKDYLYTEQDYEHLYNLYKDDFNMFGYDPNVLLFNE